MARGNCSELPAAPVGSLRCGPLVELVEQLGVLTSASDTDWHQLFKEVATPDGFEAALQTSRWRVRKSTNKASKQQEHTRNKQARCTQQQARHTITCLAPRFGQMFLLVHVPHQTNSGSVLCCPVLYLLASAHASCACIQRKWRLSMLGSPRLSPCTFAAQVPLHQRMIQQACGSYSAGIAAVLTP